MPIFTAMRPEAAALAASAPLPTVTGTISQRKSVYDLSAEEVSALRRAFSALYAISDDRGYQYVAGIHGLPLPIYCQHGSPLFAVWHRPYLQLMERLMQAAVPDVCLPYWDWTSPRAQQEGVPKIYADQKYADENGKLVDNPLYESAITFAGTDYPNTSRDPGPPSGLATLSGLVDVAMRSTDYVSHSRNLENPHNAIHIWMAGTMGIVPYAAYDPIFWAHHCNVDRLFKLWQEQHPSATAPADIMAAVLPPFSVTVADIWDTAKLGYEYVSSPGFSLSLGGQGIMADSLKSGATVASFSIQPPAPPLRKAELFFHEVQHPESSFEVRVFINEPDANETTALLGNPHYAGSLYIFGHGQCAGEVGHCDIPGIGGRDVFDIRPPHHLTPMTLSLDVAESIAKLLSGQQGTVDITLVAVDNKGKLIADSGLQFDSMSLVTE